MAPNRKNLIISSISNLSTAYNLSVISVVHVIMEYPYCGGDKCANQVTTASTSCLVGAIVGQLTFGYIGDCLGRPRALQLTMAMSILGALASAFAVPLDPSDPSSIFGFLTITRFFLGVGVGGVYPLSATIASESSAKNDRGRNASIVFSMQGVANLIVPLLAWLLLAIFGVPQTGTAGDGPGANGMAWRLALGLGALPGLLLLPFKTSPAAARVAADDKLTLNTHGTTTTTSDLEVVMLDPAAHAPPPAADETPTTLLQALKIKRYWGKLLGTAGGWLLFDITFYGNSLFQTTVLKKYVFHSKSTSDPPFHGGLATDLCPQMAVIAAIALPGYYVSVYFMDKLGRRTIQLQGFFFMAVFFAALGLFAEQLKKAPIGMLLVYSMTFFFSNFGPNSTTFILPAETYPVQVRATLNGFSAACGKVGATIGSSAFKALVNACGLEVTMLVCAAVSLAGLVLTFFFVEDKRGARMEGDELEPAPPAAAEPRAAAAAAEARP